LRAIVRHRDRMCVLCGLRPSTNVDHADGNWRNNDLANLRGLCSQCERSRTGRQHATQRGVS
jgi:5-methylcytosine-specific restriction endonuclease McrA